MIGTGNETPVAFFDGFYVLFQESELSRNKILRGIFSAEGTLVEWPQRRGSRK